MKFFQTRFLLQRAARRTKRRGFALIATLTLMMLLAMLAVALLSVASTQQRIAMQTVLLAEARQQALVGLDVAIAELQVEMGPDQRVSANSGILSDREGAFPQYVLGVWNSWDGPLYGDSPTNRANNIQATYTQGRDKLFRRWMVSSRDKDKVRDMNSVKEICSRKPGSRICMVGEGTLGRTFSPQHHIYADLLEMPSLSKNKACFAWWVGGENQKVKVNVPQRDETEDLNEVLRRTWDTPSPMILNYEDLDFLPETIEQPDKLITLASLPLLGTASQNAGMPYFFDVTTSSYSLPVNVRTGGLKQDLCLLLSKDSLSGTEFAVRNDQDCPIAENDDIPKGTEQKMPIGSWQNLFAYYNCWPDGTANDGDNFTARLIGEVAKAYTRMGGSVMNGSSMNHDSNPESVNADGSGSLYDTRAMLDQGNKKSGYARTPVMLAFMSNFAMVTEGKPEWKMADGKTPAFNLRLAYAPMFLWWNPYNVPMRIRGQQLWSQSAPYTVAWMQDYSIGQSGTWNYTWQRYATKYKPEAGSSSDGVKTGFDKPDVGQYFQNSETDVRGDIVFQPGEVLFFSCGSVDEKANDYGSFVLGYHPANVSNYKIHYYTSIGRRSGPGVPDLKTLEEKQWYVGFRLGVYKEGGTEGREYLSGFRLAPFRPEPLTVLNGFNGLSARKMDEQFGGKRAISPQSFLLGWYDPNDESQSTVFCDRQRNDSYWAADGSQSDSSVPYYVAAVGVVAKSANPNADSRIFTGMDYRTKLWQHSNPAFWGSAIIKPDHQQRQYHPYELAALDVSSGLDSSPMDNIGRNGYLGITGEGEQVSFASVLELPVHPPFSLAGFAGMRLQPGWYRTSGSTGMYKAASAMRRVQYQAGVPGVGIGNSFADPCLPAGEVYAFHRNEIPSEGGNGQIFGDFYDHGLLINDALWDRWFCSSVSDMPKGSRKEPARDVLDRFLSGKEDLPVARYKKANTPYNDSQVIARLMEKDGWKYIAQYLMIDGGFNVNSTSVEAWNAVLQGLARRKLVSSDGNRLKEVEQGKSKEQVLFSRFMLSTTDKSVDSLGGYSMRQGSGQFRGGSALLSAWGEVRKLEPESIRKLAEEMVKQVRKRGPFLNMSDFINRRLEKNGGELALTGALQAAIDATDINRDFQEVIVKPQEGNMYKFPEAEKGSMYTAAPGYLIQSDILASLGNILTVRDDTFTVRAYGCVRSPRNAILAQAWCEAVVQRTMDYVDPSNAPSDAEYDPDGSQGGGLSVANKVMGRSFRIVSFKWLDLWDI
ncbi:MAG: hypothetical protein IJB00_03505 [Akkermansia sp.]|nr:hypothetical protein [Akkermansia sp.]